MPRPLVATIHLAAMQHNLALAKANAGEAKVWAVIKANAYGHGLEHAVRGFAAADGLALIELDGAVRLRGMGWDKPILLLEGFFDASDLSAIIANRLDTVIHNVEQIAILERAQKSGQLGEPINISLKMNSGMNRLGLPPTVYQNAHARLRALAGVGGITLMTHFANADQRPHPVLPVSQQVKCFLEGTQGLDGAVSLSNSASSLLYPELAADWIRPGIMLYGGTPGAKTAQQFGLQATMTLSSEIIGIQHINASDAVGYNSRFVADRSMPIGVVACGYADGYPRHAPSGTPIIVDGICTRLVGQVSMDMMMVDLTPVPTAKVGSQVTLWGQGLPIDIVANCANTIGYELMCALAARVRVVVDEGS